MQEKTPEWIDYDAAGNGGSESQDFRAYWFDSLRNRFKYETKNATFSVKQHSQIKRFMAEYGGSEWREMIDHWHTVLRFSRASNVSMFYAHRHSTFEHVQSGTKQVKLQDKDYEW